MQHSSILMRRLNISVTAERLTTFIRTTVNNAGFSRVAVALSGGVDSATAAALATAALGPDNVFALLLPYGDWHAQAQQLAWTLLDRLGIPAAQVEEVDIVPMVDAFLRSANLHLPRPGDGAASADPERLRAGNIMARARMVVLFDMARRLNALVLGTENKSEHYLGYYTRFGDEASDLEPLRTLYKTEVYGLADYLGVPREILAAAPTAGLWPGQTDEGQFGFSYREADEVLYGLYEAKLSPQQLVERGLDRATVDAVQAWVQQVDFKHNLPYVAPEPVVVNE